MIRLGVALGYVEGRRVNIPRARAVLDELERELAQGLDSVTMLSLSAQTSGYLETAGIITIGHLRLLTDIELMSLPGMGTARLHEVRVALMSHDEE